MWDKVERGRGENDEREKVGGRRGGGRRDKDEGTSGKGQGARGKGSCSPHTGLVGS